MSDHVKLRSVHLGLSALSIAFGKALVPTMWSFRQRKLYGDAEVNELLPRFMLKVSP